MVPFGFENRSEQARVFRHDNSRLAGFHRSGPVECEFPGIVNGTFNADRGSGIYPPSPDDSSVDEDFDIASLHRVVGKMQGEWAQCESST